MIWRQEVLLLLFQVRAILRHEAEEFFDKILELKVYPNLLEKVKEMLDLIEKKQVKSVDDFEEALIPQVRKLGGEIMQTWACNEEKLMRENLEEKGEKPHSKETEFNPLNSEEAKVLIAEIDGGMVPIVEFGEKIKGIDLRKTRKVCWKEAKLCFARDHRKIGRVYAAVIGTPEEGGAKLYECALRAGLEETTYVHALGDGAPWIVDQIENRFGMQAHFLVDFFHMSEYLAEASRWCNALDPQVWLEENKVKMKTNEHEKVFCELKTRLEQIKVDFIFRSNLSYSFIFF
jgi:hypothetical protein